MEDVATIVLAVAILLVMVGIIQPLAVRLRLPTSVLLAAIGTALGAAAGFLLQSSATPMIDGMVEPFAHPPVTAEGFLFIFLPILLFQAALSLDVRRLFDDAVPILVLAVVAVLVTTGLVGVTVHWLTGVPLVACLLLGSIVATTDPSAVVSIFRDLGAPARLTRLVEGESLLNDAAAISIFTILIGMIGSGGRPDLIGGAVHFVTSFAGGVLFGFAAGRLLTLIVPWLRDDRAAEMTLTLALPYIVFVVAEKMLGLSGVVGVVAASLTVGSTGRARVSPANWRFLEDLWEQLAFWAGSLVFILAAITVPHLLVDANLRDLVTLAGVLLSALAARLAVLFGLLPPLTALRLSPMITTPYKLAIAWGGLRGAVTVALALAVSEEDVLGDEVKRFVGVAATGFVLVSLFVNGTSLRLVMGLLGLDRLSPRDIALRAQVLALSTAQVRDALADRARDFRIRDTAAQAVLRAYDGRVERAVAQQADTVKLFERDRLAIGLVALASQERRLIMDYHAQRTVSREVIERRLNDADHMLDGARIGGRVGYLRAARRSTGFSLGMRLANLLHSRFGIEGPLARRLARRFEGLLVTRMVLAELAGFVEHRLKALVGERMAEVLDEVLKARRENVRRSLDALQLQYPEYAEALERRLLKQSALRQELIEYQARYDEGLIGQELFNDLIRSNRAQRAQVDQRPHLDLRLDAQQMMRRIDLFSALDRTQADRLARLFKPSIALPGQVIFRKGQRGDSVLFIASGALEVRLPNGALPLGRGAIVGEMALLTGMPRSADVVALTYSQLLVLYAAEFHQFLDGNPDIRRRVEDIIAERQQNSGRKTPVAAQPG